jgi:outer membrane receptor protein involved in Fe transport
MIYAFYSRGYKGGGANPPGVGFNKGPYHVCEVGPELCEAFNLPPDFTIPPTLQTLPYPLIFEPEFVNAYEVGAKNTLLGGGLVLNGDVFFYDYKDYQVSQIKDRTAVNENFDAKIWGLEMEAMFQPTRNLRFNGTFGYQDSKIANGEQSIDLMDRTQGNPDWAVVKAWIQLPSNCVIKKEWLEQISPSYYAGICPGSSTNNPALTPEQYAELPNGGAGFFADLGGNQLPNAPHWTTSLGAQYGFDFLDGWRATVRADAYWQSQSWARVYNDNPYDKLHGWYNANLSVWFEKPDEDLKIELYAKNLLDKTPITDAFLNSDDTGLTTNVFVLDPRLIGLSIRKGF